MNSRITTFLTVTLILVGAIGYQSVEGQLLSTIPDSLADNVVGSSERLLSTDWDRDLKNENQSKATFGQARTDHQVLLLAYTLNRMQHNKSREAKMVAEEITAKYPDNLDGWMLKAWLNSLTNNYDVACMNMRSLRQAMSRTKTSAANEKAIFQRLGRLIGYMQGPVVDRVNADVLEATILSIAKGASPEAVNTFNASRDATLEKHDEILKAHAKKSQAELAKVQAENEQEAINLEKQNAQLDKTESQLLPERERIREEATRRISALEQEGRSMEIQLSQISTDILLTRRNLDTLYTSLYNLQNSPRAYQVSRFGLTTQIQNAEIGLASLQNSGVAISNQLAGVRNNIAAARNAADRQIRELNKEIKKTVSAKKRNMNKLARIARGPKVADGKRHAMLNKVTSLVTFDQIPLELYRQDILEALK